MAGDGQAALLRYQRLLLPVLALNRVGQEWLGSLQEAFLHAGHYVAAAGNDSNQGMGLVAQQQHMLAKGLRCYRVNLSGQ